MSLYVHTYVTGGREFNRKEYFERITKNVKKLGHFPKHQNIKNIHVTKQVHFL